MYNVKGGFTICGNTVGVLIVIIILHGHGQNLHGGHGNQIKSII